MKNSLAAGVRTSQRIQIDTGRCIAFMGDACRVYATPSLVRDIEQTCRDLLLAHLDAGEDSLGTRVEVDHLAPTLADMWVEIDVTIAEVKGRAVTFEFTARDAVEQVARGRHWRFVADVEKTAARLQQKAAKAAAG
ncbi:MAG: LysR family transcriptional regulator [Gammaproteobacteria bacterium]|nr:LysR family transcriptional regulator [Gammaproteobacteria bacterium]